MVNFRRLGCEKGELVSAGSKAADATPQDKSEMGVFASFVLIASAILLAADVLYWFGTGASGTVGAVLTGALTALATAATQKKAMVWALSIVALLGAAANAARTAVEPGHLTQAAQIPVRPVLGWSGPLDIGASGAFTIPVRAGYSRAVIRLHVQDANPEAVACTPDTQVMIAVGPENNLGSGRLLSSPHWTTGVSLAGFTRSASIHVTISTTQPQQVHCPVDITVPSVILDRT
jgi:hypothetical protein